MSQEPVAWKIWWDNREWIVTEDIEDYEMAIKNNMPITPLYTQKFTEEKNEKT